MTPSPCRNLCRAGNQLGESVIEDRACGMIHWVDITGKELHQLDREGRHAVRSLSVEPGFVALGESGSLLVGGDDRLLRLDAEGETSIGIAGIVPGEVINDGAVHPGGDWLVFGTRHRDEIEPLGHMWVVGRTARCLPQSFTVFNGPAFSIDGKRLFYTDSPTGIIVTATFDATTGDVGPPREIARVPGAHGFPDGMIVDSLDRLWVAHWDGGRITCFEADGSVGRVLEVPVIRPTSLAFTGSDGATLLVTSAAPDSGPAGKEDGRPYRDGDLLALEAGCTGAPTPRLHFDPLRSLADGHHATA